MPTVEFVGQSSQDPGNISAGTSRLVNFYRQLHEDKYVLKGVLGTEAFASLSGVFTRGLFEHRGNVYAVNSGLLHMISSAGVVTNLGAIDDDPNTGISSNGDSITVAANGKYFLHDGVSVFQPSGGRLEEISDVTNIAQRTILIGKNREIEFTSVNAPETRNGLSYVTAEYGDDNNLRGERVNGLLWVFKEKSIERFQPVATGLAALPGGAIDVGLKSWGLLTKIPQGVFFVGNDNNVYGAGSGGLGSPVQNRAVARCLENNDPTHCFYYEDEDHKHCVIRFSDRPSWIYDLATGEWHERAESRVNAWSAVGAVEAFGKFYVGYDTGAVRQLKRNSVDGDDPLYRQAVSRTFWGEGNRFKIPLMEFMGRVGRSDMGRDAQMMLRLSRDGGHLWGKPKVRSMGGVGEYDQTLRFRNLGQFRRLTAEISVSDPVDLSFVAKVTI